MGEILFDIEKIRQAARRLGIAAEDVGHQGTRLLHAVEGAKSYDGQYAPWVQGLAGESKAEAGRFVERLEWQSGDLQVIARRFEQADELEARGYLYTAALARMSIDAGQLFLLSAQDCLDITGRPYWISEEQWRRIPMRERMEILRALREAYSRQLARIEQLRTPPWEKDRDWIRRALGLKPEQITPEKAEAIARLQAALEGEDLAKAWDDFWANQAMFKIGVGDDMSQAFLIYMLGLEGAGAALESIPDGAGLVHRAPDGSVESVVVAEGQRNTTPYSDPEGDLVRYGIVPDSGPPQYLNLGEVPQFEGQAYPASHPNLCGQLATAVTMGVDPVEALRRFNELQGGSDILKDPLAKTGPDQIKALLEAYGWEGERVGYANDPHPWRDASGYAPKPEQIEAHLEHDRTVKALINVNEGSGFIEAAGSNKPVPHWANILQIVHTREGEDVVRVYNPLMDREEWYSFDHLVEAWTPGGVNYLAVVETPSPSQLALPSPNNPGELEILGWP